MTVSVVYRKNHWLSILAAVSYTAISTPACVSAPSPSRCGHGCWAKSVCLSLSTLVSTVVQFPTLLWSLDGSAGGRRSAAWCARANRNARLCDGVFYCEESPFYFYKVLCLLYLCSFTFVCYYCLRLYIIHIALFSHLGRVRYFRYGHLIYYVILYRLHLLTHHLQRDAEVRGQKIPTKVKLTIYILDSFRHCELWQVHQNAPEHTIWDEKFL